MLFGSNLTLHFYRNFLVFQILIHQIVFQKNLIYFLIVLIFVNLSEFLGVLSFQIADYLAFFYFKILFLFQLFGLVNCFQMQLIFLHFFELLFISFFKHLNLHQFFIQFLFFDKSFILFDLLIFFNVILRFFGFHYNLLNHLHMLGIKIIIHLFFFLFSKHEFINVIIIFTSFFLNRRISFLLPKLGQFLSLLDLVH